MYTATIYINDTEVFQRSGCEVDSLYAAMLAYAYEHQEHYCGVIIDDESNKVVKRFCTSSID